MGDVIRREARQEILDAANDVRRRVSQWMAKPFSMRHINQAVRVCRHRGLVEDHVLVAAGFNPVKR